ncbi:MAG: hypothetical protein J6W75_13180 [Bacteroidaceae bacterium]|nr:hypothetical protein [Bacteroidaceae bacterium]
MKKVAFMFVAAMAISFASCGGAQQKAEEACDSVCCEAAEVVDTLAEVVDSVAAEVVEEAAEVVAE